jgi:hypothetical protein
METYILLEALKRDSWSKLNSRKKKAGERRKSLLLLGSLFLTHMRLLKNNESWDGVMIATLVEMLKWIQKVLVEIFTDMDSKFRIVAMFITKLDTGLRCVWDLTPQRSTHASHYMPIFQWVIICRTVNTHFGCRLRCSTRRKNLTYLNKKCVYFFEHLSAP